MEGQEPLKTYLTYRVPYADTDQMGVVYYANFFVLFERCRNEILRDWGVTYKQVEAMGVMLPVVEAHCEYRRPALYDDLLEIRGRFEFLSQTRIKARCEVVREGVLLAHGHTMHVSIDAGTRRPTRLPDLLMQRLETGS